MIFTGDHEPANMHAFGASGEAKIDLGRDGQAPRLIWVKGLTNADVWRTMAEVARRRDVLLAAWGRIHGGDQA